MNQPTLFVFVTAAGSARQMPQFLDRCVSARWETFVVASPNVAQVIPLEDLYDLPGVTPIRHYGQPPLDRFPFGTMLVAPCTFNTFNKLAHGLADSLVTAMVADALGSGCPVFVAPAMNRGLWNHPQTQVSLVRLQQWGCQIIGPHVENGEVGMVSHDELFARVQQHFENNAPHL